MVGINIVSWEQEWCYCSSKIFRWVPEGRYRCTEYIVIAPFWFSNGTSLKCNNALLALNWPYVSPKNYHVLTLSHLRPRHFLSFPYLHVPISNANGSWLTLYSTLYVCLMLRWKAYHYMTRTRNVNASSSPLKRHFWTWQKYTCVRRVHFSYKIILCA